MSLISLCIRQEPFSFPTELERDPLLERWDDLQGREYGFGLKKDSHYWMKIHRAGTFVALDGRLEVYGFPDPRADLGNFRDLFFHVIAPWLLQRQEWECLHASAVLNGDGVIFFMGTSGRGKSTLARAFCEHGAMAYADDAAPFLVQDDMVLCARTPQPLRLREPAASHFAPGPRRDFDQLHWEPKLSLRPLSVIYSLDRMGAADDRSDAVIAPVPRFPAFRLLLEEAHCISMSDAACNRKMVRNYLSLAKIAPVFRLSFPARLDAVPGIVARIQDHQRSLQHA